MLDLSHLPEGGADVQIFNALGTSDWQTWRKPRGRSHATIIAISPGAGGGGGASGAAGTNRGGGGGGGSGTSNRIILPMLFVPDILFCNVGPGAAGGAAGAAGSDAGLTIVSVRPNSSGQNRFFSATSNVTLALGGGAGTATAGGAGGTGAGQGSVGSMGFAQMFGPSFTKSGETGANGGSQAGAAGGSITWNNSTGILTGGAGGGGTPAANIDFAGGQITGSEWFPTIAGGLAAAGRGQNGFFSALPWVTSGGSGGGTAGAAGVAGAGGDGTIGCGGGGGGGGITGGAGGRGGPGQIIIISW